MCRNECQLAAESDRSAYDERADFSDLRVLGYCDYFTEESSGGAERVTAEVYRRLIDRGAAVTVIALVPGAKAGQRDVHGVPTVIVPATDLSKLLRAQVAVGRGLSRAGEHVLEELRPNVIHASSIHFQGSIAGARLAGRRRIPLVTTGHVGSIRKLPVVTRAATFAYENSVSRFLIRSSARVIAVSAAVARHLESRGASRGMVSVVENGVDHGRFAPTERNVGRTEIMFVGRLIQNKGPMEVLNAFAGLENVDARLTFVGDGPMRESLESRTRDLSASTQVRFVGHVQDVAPHLSDADVLVRPSQTEGQSLAILEAMASGIAVIASDIEANSELITHGEEGLLVAPGDTSELARAIERLIADRSLRGNLAASAYRRSLGHSWDKCAVETGRVLQSVAMTEGY